MYYAKFAMRHPISIREHRKKKILLHKVRDRKSKWDIMCNVIGKKNYKEKVSENEIK